MTTMKEAAGAAELEALRAELARKIDAYVQVEGPQETPLPNFFLAKRTEQTECGTASYQPEFVVFAQGEKRITVGGVTHQCDSTSMLLTSVDLPVVSQITKASASEPLLGVVLRLDMALVREILSQDEFREPASASGARGMAVGKTPVEMLRACLRLMELLESPRDIAFMGSLMEREIVYRLLRSQLGRHLRAIATLGENENRTAKAVAWLKANYQKPVRVEELAGVAQMGVSTFHHHFRSLTQMSPLQYQKRLRLHTARLRMMTEGMDAASAAFEVGYESASQFNREYSRMFGLPPMRDIKAQRVSGAEMGEGLRAS